MRDYVTIKADITEALRTGDRDARLRLGQEMLTLDDPKATVDGLNVLGVEHHQAGDYPKALEYYRMALQKVDEMHDRANAAAIMTNIGGVYSSTGDFPQAVKHCQHAIQIFEELGNQGHAAEAMCILGNVYQHTYDYERSLEQYQRALQIHEELGNGQGAALVIGNMGGVYWNYEEHERAIEYFRRAIDTLEGMGKHDKTVSIRGNLVSVLLTLHRDDEAVEVLSAMSTASNDNPVNRAWYHTNLSLLAEHNGDLDAAWDHLQRSLADVITIGAREHEAHIHQLLRDLAQKRNDFVAYIDHNTAYQRVTEEIRGKEATQKLAMMEAERKMEQLERERDKERALLYGALPKSVADRMIRGEKVTSDHFLAAAVLFADVADFTENTAVLHPTDVVALLDGLFAVFDAICERHAVVKVKTIGDSYMCFKGDASPAENAQAIAAVATEIHAHVAKRTYPTNADPTPLRMRVGLHIGPATAGVLGTQRLQYDVWGDTVNVASRMESTGEPGRIHISAAFAQALTNAPYSIVPRGEVEIKGKGAMSTFWVEAQ